MTRTRGGVTRRALFGGVATCAAASAQSRFGPVLTKAVAAFHTNDDDKDSDTALYVYVNRGRDVIARAEDVLGYYSDNSAHRVELRVLIQATRDECERGCSVMISVRPNGHDTWRFNLRLELFFSDSLPPIGRQFNRIELNQNNREFRASW